MNTVGDWNCIPIGVRASPYCSSSFWLFCARSKNNVCITNFAPKYYMIKSYLLCFYPVFPTSLAISASWREKTEPQNPHRRGRPAIGGQTSAPARNSFFIIRQLGEPFLRRGTGSYQHSRPFVSIRGSNHLRNMRNLRTKIGCEFVALVRGIWTKWRCRRWS